MGDGKWEMGMGNGIWDPAGTLRHSLPDEDASSQMPAPPAGALGIEAASFASGEGTGFGNGDPGTGFPDGPRARSNQQAKIQRKARRRQTNAMKRLMAKGEGIWDMGYGPWEI